jgi:hypothetical protein
VNILGDVEVATSSTFRFLSDGDEDDFLANARRPKSYFFAGNFSMLLYKLIGKSYNNRNTKRNHSSGRKTEVSQPQCKLKSASILIDSNPFTNYAQFNNELQTIYRRFFKDINTTNKESLQTNADNDFTIVNELQIIQQLY